MTSPATQPARFATRRRTRQLVPGTETMNKSGRCDRHDHLPKSSRPPAHASLIADPFDRALGEEATPGRELQVGRAPRASVRRGDRLGLAEAAMTGGVELGQFVVAVEYLGLAVTQFRAQ